MTMKLCGKEVVEIDGDGDQNVEKIVFGHDDQYIIWNYSAFRHMWE